MLRSAFSIIAGSAALLPTIAHAGSVPADRHARDANRTPVHLAGDVFVERFEPAPGGRTARVLERADALHPGDRLVFVVSWSNNDRSGLVVSNPVPRSILYQPGNSDLSQEVSVDGGRTWGALAALQVHDSGGWRPALPGDVTHVRWHVPGGAGQITYRGVVR